MGDCSSACGGPIHHEQSECTGNHQRHRLNSSTGTDSDEADTRPTPPPSEQGSTSSFLEARPQSRSVNTPQGAVQQTLQNFGWPLPKRTRDDNSVVGGAVTTNLPAGSSTRVFEQANAGVPSARRPQRHRPNQNTIPRSSTNGNSAGFVVTPGTTCVHWSDDVGTPGWQPQGASMRAVERGAGCREEHRRYGDRSSLDDERREERQLRGTAVMFVAVYNAVEALARTTPAFLGLTLLAGSIATGVNRNIRLLILIIIILGTTSFSWCAAFPPPPPPNAVCSTPLGGPSYLHGFWVTAPPVPPAPRTKGEAAVAELERGIWLWRKMFSVRKLVAGLMALACLPSLLDALAQVLFYRLASRASNGWLTLAFGVSSALYCGFVLTRVAGQGPAALNSCMQYRFLQLSRQVLFSAAMALAVRRDWRLLSWYSSVGLLATATVFLSAVSARAAERSVRYGLAVALEEVLGNVQHEVSTESMLYLAFWRWLVDFWSQRFQFSKADMRIMLLHAAAAIEKQHRPPRVARVQHESGHGDVTSDGAQVAGGRPSTEMRKSVSGLARWLGGARTAGVGDLCPAERVEAVVDAIAPGWASCLAVLLVRACPGLCALVLLLVFDVVSPLLRRTFGYSDVGVGRVESGEDWCVPTQQLVWVGVALFLGPGAIEVLRLQALRIELSGNKRTAGKEGSTPSFDSFTLLLGKSNPALACVWANAQRGLDCLRAERAQQNGQQSDSPLVNQPAPLSEDAISRAADTPAIPTMTPLPVIDDTDRGHGKTNAGVAARPRTSAIPNPFFLGAFARGTPDTTIATAVAPTAIFTSAVGDASSASSVDPGLQWTERNNDIGRLHVARGGDDGGAPSIGPSVAGSQVVLRQDAGAAAADATLEAPEDSCYSGQERKTVECEKGGISPSVPAGAGYPVSAPPTSTRARTGAEPQPHQQRRRRRRQQLDVLEEEHSNRNDSDEWTGTSAHDDGAGMPPSGADDVTGNSDITANHGKHDRARPLSMAPMVSSQPGPPQQQPPPPPPPPPPQPETMSSGSASQNDAQSEATKNMSSSAHTPKCETTSEDTAAGETSTIDRAVKTDTVEAIAAAAAAASISPCPPSRATEDKGWVLGAGEVLVGVAGGATDAVLGTVADVAGGLLGAAGDATGGAVGILLGTLSWWGGGGGGGGAESGRGKEPESEKETGKGVKGDKVDAVVAPPSELPQSDKTACGGGRAAGDEGEVCARRGRGGVSSSSTEKDSGVSEGCRRDNLLSNGWSVATFSRVPPEEASTADAGGVRSSDSDATENPAVYGARARGLDRDAAKEGLASPASDKKRLGCDHVAVEGANSRRGGDSPDSSKSDGVVVVLPGAEPSEGGESRLARNESAGNIDGKTVILKDRKTPVEDDVRVTGAVKSEKIVLTDQNKDAFVGDNTAAVAAAGLVGNRFTVVEERNCHSGQVEVIVEGGNRDSKRANAAWIARAQASSVGGDSGDGDRGEDALGRDQEKGGEKVNSGAQEKEKPTPESASSTSKPGGSEQGGILADLAGWTVSHVSNTIVSLSGFHVFGGDGANRSDGDSGGGEGVKMTTTNCRGAEHRSHARNSKEPRL